MNIAIVGAGFTGLSAAYELISKGHKVTVFEKDPYPGGLAVGYEEKGWDWTLEKHYHHWFSNDKFIINLAKKTGYKTFKKRPKTSSFVSGGIYQLDSPISLLLFPKISLFERLRMGMALAFFKGNPFWKFLERYKADKTLPRLMGKNAYRVIWQPLFINKFGSFAGDISLAWFWARIKKRTSTLVYPQRGFLDFARHLQKVIEIRGGEFYYNTQVLKIQSKNPSSAKKGIIISADLDESKINGKITQPRVKNLEFDAAVVTLPTPAFMKITPALPRNYKEKYSKLQGLSAINLIIRLKKPYFKDQTYWLNICETDFPFMAIVEHTNFMDKKHYNNEHIIYVGKYLAHDHPYMSLSAAKLLEIYDPYLSKINPDYKTSVIDYKLFKAPFAQPIVPPNYSKKIPPIETPLKNVYLANIQQVYPWDRGTNYAVELGIKVAQKIIDEKR